MEGSRLGVYYLKTGASQRASKVIYDRKDSAIARVKPGEFDWPTIFAGAVDFPYHGDHARVERQRSSCQSGSSSGGKKSWSDSQLRSEFPENHLEFSQMQQK